MVRRTRFEASMDKRRALHAAEKDGQVADSMEVRMELVKRMNAGELTLAQVQDELKKIKRNAKKNGLVTRSQAFSRG
jgi:hypothetical protein